MRRISLRRILFFLGVSISIITLIYMALQLFAESNLSITQTEFTHNIAVAALIFLFGAYLSFTFKPRKDSGI